MTEQTSTSEAAAGFVEELGPQGKSALPRSPAKQEILSWIYSWSAHVRRRPLYRKRAPPFSWPVTTT